MKAFVTCPMCKGEGLSASLGGGMKYQCGFCGGYGITTETKAIKYIELMKRLDKIYELHLS